MKKFKSLKLMLLAVVALCSSNAFAESLVGKTIFKKPYLYTILSVNSTAKTGTVSVQQNDAGNETSLTIPGTFKETVQGDEYTGEMEFTVTTIEMYGFATLDKLTAITLPSTITEIGYGAFAGTKIDILDLSSTKITVVNNMFESSFKYGALPFTAETLAAYNSLYTANGLNIFGVAVESSKAYAYNATLTGAIANDGNATVAAGTAKAYNATLDGAIDNDGNYVAPEDADDDHPVTIAIAKAYNKTLADALLENGTAKVYADGTAPEDFPAHNILVADAKAYNATLAGAATTATLISSISAAQKGQYAVAYGVDLAGDDPGDPGSKFTADEADKYNALLVNALPIVADETISAALAIVYNANGTALGLPIDGNKVSTDKADAYNATLALALPIDGTSKVTAVKANGYNLTLAGAIPASGFIITNNTTPNIEAAIAYNAGLADAKIITDENEASKIEATPNNYLKEVRLPNTWQYIGAAPVAGVNTLGAFENCTKLETVDFGGTPAVPATQVQVIREKAFLGTALKALTLTNTNVTSIPQNILVDVKNLGGAVGGSATANNTLLTFTANVKLQSIGAYAFNTCVKLGPVSFPENSALTAIGNYAFGTTTLMTSIDLSNCKKMTTLTGTPFVAEGAGKTNNVLTTVKLPAGDGKNGTNKFTTIGTALANLTVLATLNNYNYLTAVGAGAFENDAALTSLTFQGDVASIAGTAFNGCTGLAELTIAGNTNVTGGVFDAAASGALTTLKIIGNVTGNYNLAAFANCTNIETLQIAVNEAGKNVNGTFGANAIAVKDGATINIGEVKKSLSGAIKALGNVTKLTLGKMNVDLHDANAFVTTTGANKIAAVEVGQIAQTLRPDVFGQAETITFKGSIDVALTATDAVNSALTEIDFGQNVILNSANTIPAVTFNEVKAPNLVSVIWHPSTLPTAQVFNQAAFGSAAGLDATVLFETETEVAELYDFSKANLFRVSFTADLVKYPIELAAPAGSAYNYGKHYQTVATKISKSQNGESVIVYGAYVDSKDKNIYLEQLHIIDGYYWVPARVPVIVKSANNTEVIAEKQGGPNSMNFVAGGANYVSEIAYLESDCIGQQLMDKTGDIDWSDPNRVATVDNPDYDLYAMAKTSTYGMKWKMFGSATNLKTGLFYVRCAKGGAPASELNVIWTDGSEESNTTGIENVNVAKHQFDGEIFNLQGIRVSEPVKGQIYIQNGKKFMMK